MKKVLIISPYFPPSNAADMQRIRMSLPYFKEFGWDAEVVTVDPIYSEMVKDPLLTQSIPTTIKIHTVSAFSKRWTSKLGLGSLALRSMWYYLKAVNKLIAKNRFDLIYFSTTQFPIAILGAYWKRKFGISYVIDMQDPWHSNYYQDKPKSERPKKYWFSYRLNKYLEPIAMKSVDGLISVSDAYIEQLKQRYIWLKNIPSKIITFGYFEKDFEIVRENSATITDVLVSEPNTINLVYVGRGGYDMQPAVRLLFKTFKSCLEEDEVAFSNFRFHFIGTSYAAKGMGTPTISPIATEFGLSAFVNENTNRISFYESIKALQAADALLIPGSNDPGYTASKIFPYILTGKCLLGIFNPSSSAYHIIKKSHNGFVADLMKPKLALEEIKRYLIGIATHQLTTSNQQINNISEYSAKNMTKLQCELFNRIVL